MLASSKLAKDLVMHQSEITDLMLASSELAKIL
jgi:hypothetical protein